MARASLQSGLLVAIGLVQFLAMGCNAPDQPITAARLKNATLSSTDGTHLWRFTESRVVIQGRSASVPKGLVKALFGSEMDTLRVEGDWRLDEQKGLLVLSNFDAGGKKQTNEVQLPIRPAGPLRAEILGQQYNIHMTAPPASGP